MGTQVVTSEIAAAKAIATLAHRGQTDKIGVDYIEHPRRVAARLTKLEAAPTHVRLPGCMT
jgi:(p)ppGpp synthase/HD superfamily hydrolase